MGWLSTAAVLVDGEIVSCVSEERFSRRKNDMSYPYRAIDECLRIAGLEGKDLDAVALASRQAGPDDMRVRRYSAFSVADWIREQNEFWRPTLYDSARVSYPDVFADKIALSDDDPFDWSLIDFTLPGLNPAPRVAAFSPMRVEALARHLRIARERVQVMEHHHCHAMYGYYSAPVRQRSALVLTMDAVGDGLNATVNTMIDGTMTRIAQSSDCQMGRLWKCMTLLLGMKPHEDEYKLMGLAPYATAYHTGAPHDLFRRTMRVKGLGFAYGEKPPDLYFWFRERLAACRFDGIAGGLQTYLEEVFREWVHNAIEVTGIRNVILSGGVAMNVKAAMAVAELPEVEDLFIPASCGDESHAMGAAWALYQELAPSGRDAVERAPVLQHVYLGTRYDAHDIERVLGVASAAGYEVVPHAPPNLVARQLAAGRVLGLLSGRMEFGARALGHRSIVADPRRQRIVNLINEKVKNRDFWMPFAPSILAERAHDYMVNPKGLRSPYMTLAFASTERAHRDLPAALHPADLTMRPHVVSKDAAPEYHRLISEFQSLTGVGALLNTSFNLHGEPIVESPSDALDTFTRSGLDLLLLEDALVAKPGKLVGGDVAGREPVAD